MRTFGWLLAHKPMGDEMVGQRGMAWREAIERWRAGNGAGVYRRANRRAIKASRLAAWKKRKALGAARRLARRA